MWIVVIVNNNNVTTTKRSFNESVDTVRVQLVVHGAADLRVMGTKPVLSIFVENFHSSDIISFPLAVTLGRYILRCDHSAQLIGMFTCLK